MSKVEDRALEKYPDFKGEDSFSTVNINKKRKLRRQGFIEGYNQAEKDLELTYDDICEIMEIREEVLEMDSYENLYEEILKRFKERKNE